MKSLFAGVICFLMVAAGNTFAQQPINGATREDIQKLYEVLQQRRNFDVLTVGMAQQAAQRAGETFVRENPKATPEAVAKAQKAASDAIQEIMKNLHFEEIVEAMVPIYQRHFTHDDIQTAIAYYSSPTGQKFIAEMPALMMEGMQVAKSIVDKHLPEVEQAAERAARGTAGESSSEK